MGGFTGHEISDDMTVRVSVRVRERICFINVVRVGMEGLRTPTENACV